MGMRNSREMLYFLTRGEGPRIVFPNNRSVREGVVEDSGWICGCVFGNHHGWNAEKTTAWNLTRLPQTRGSERRSTTTGPSCTNPQGSSFLKIIAVRYHEPKDQKTYLHVAYSTDLVRTKQHPLSSTINRIIMRLKAK